MENIIIWVAMMFFTPTYHDYPMESKSTLPITAYYDPSFLGIELKKDLYLKLETDGISTCSAEVTWRF